MTSHTEHSTTISAAALAAQLRATQEANTRLISQVVELEHERDRWRTLYEQERCEGCGGLGTYDGHALYPDEFAPGERGVCECCGGAQASPRAVDPPPHCWNCGLPLAGDGVHIARAGRTVTTHRVCADHLFSQGWELVAKRGDL